MRPHGDAGQHADDEAHDRGSDDGRQVGPPVVGDEDRGRVRTDPVERAVPERDLPVEPGEQVEGQDRGTA